MTPEREEPVVDSAKPAMDDVCAVDARAMAELKSLRISLKERFWRPPVLRQVWGVEQSEDKVCCRAK